MKPKPERAAQEAMDKEVDENAGNTPSCFAPKPAPAVAKDEAESFSSLPAPKPASAKGEKEAPSSLAAEPTMGQGRGEIATPKEGARGPASSAAGPSSLAAALSAIGQAGIPAAGAIPFSAARLLPAASARRIPAGAATVFSCVFPYYSEKAAGGNLSVYCAVADYHKVAGALLADACRRLAALFPGEEFVYFVDAAPLAEVDAAARAGLGVVGQNTLLITPRWGSWVFLGEIVTTLAVPCAPTEVRPCLGCGLCRRACPGAALGEKGLDGARCISAVGQKKGPLTPEEAALVSAGEKCFGCDICQEVCPMNRRTEEGLALFHGDIMKTLTLADLDGTRWRERAFAWRGEEVLRRNLRLTGKG